jgi:hypothetical protein
MTLGVGMRNIQKKLKEEGKTFSNYWMMLEKN